MPWEAVLWTFFLASGMGWNSLCFFPAPDLETIMSSKLGDVIGLCYLTLLPRALRLSTVSCIVLASENCGNAFLCGTVPEYYAAC